MKVTIDKASVQLIQHTLQEELNMPIEEFKAMRSQHFESRETDDAYEIEISRAFLKCYLKLVIKYHRVIVGVVNLITPLLESFKRDTKELTEMLMEPAE